MVKKSDYTDKIVEAAESMGVKPGDVIDAQVYHEDDCELLLGLGGCNCEPDVKLVRLTE